jgi:hypothetical protein
MPFLKALKMRSKMDPLLQAFLGGLEGSQHYRGLSRPKMPSKGDKKVQKTPKKPQNLQNHQNQF